MGFGGRPNPTRAFPQTLYPIPLFSLSRTLFRTPWPPSTMPAVANDSKVDLAALMEAHQAGVWRFLRVLGADVALADDLTQETFLSVYRAGFEDRGEKSTRAYLRTVAKH